MSDNRNRRRITLFISSLTGGGAERVTCSLANYLNTHGYAVDVITMSDKKDTYILDKNINRIRLLHKNERSNKVRDFLLRQKRLKDFVVKSQDVDCYVVMLPITIYMLMRLKKYTNSKIIFSERNNPKSYNLLKKMMMKYAAKKCDGLVVQTKEISDWYKNVANRVIIPNAINKGAIIPNKSKEKKKKIVAVGRLEKQKNYPMLVRAFAIFDKANPSYELEIYGQGSQKRKIEKLIKKLNLTNKIKLMGYSENISERISDASCFVMASNFEGMPNALIEAMCAGLPCIATDCDGGGIRALIKNGENGVMVKKNDVNGLSIALSKVIKDEDYAKKISSESMKLGAELSHDYVYNKWMGYIEKIMRTSEKYE